MIFKQIDPKDFKLVDFYKENPHEMIYEPLKSIATPGRESYVVLGYDGEIMAATSVSYVNSWLAKLHTTLVHPDHRGKGIGRFVNESIEKRLTKQGYGKITSTVYVENIPSIILKLKLGYIIEGTLRDHEFVGQHEYIVGKILKEE